MRTLLISLLLASATPALAAPEDSGRGFHAQDERSEARSEAREERRQARSEKAETRAQAVAVHARSSEGPAQAEAAARADQPSLERIRAVRSGSRDSAAAVRNWRMDERQRLAGVRPSLEAEQELAQGRGIERVERGRSHPGPKLVMAPGESLRQSDRPLPRVLRNRVGGVSSAPEEGSQPPLRLEGRRRDSGRWSGHWRNDRRYDWWSWRNRHRSLFRLGFYHDPFGWGYRRHSIGWRLWPSYYSSNYWLHDPWQYRLPYAPPGYRWIRYYDDAVLVDTWDGRIVDVIYNFFW